MPDVEIVNPATQERHVIDDAELPAAKAKGYRPANLAPTAPLTSASPAAPLLAGPSSVISDTDLTPDGAIRAFNPKTGEEIHVEGKSLTDVQAIRDKGYVLASDRALDAQTAAKRQAADEERRAKLGIEGYDPDVLKEDYAKRGILGLSLPPSVDVAAAGVAAPFQELADAARNRLPGGRTPEQQKAVEEAREEQIAQHRTAYWVGRLPAEAAGILGAGKAATAVAGRIVSPIARLSAEAAVFAAPDATAKILNADPQGAAESVALTVAGNMALHGIFSLGAKAAGRVAQASVEAADRTLSGEAVQAGKSVLAEHFGPAVAERLPTELKPLMEAAGITEKEALDPARFVQRINEVKNEDANVGKAYDALGRADRGELQQTLAEADADLITLPEHPGIDAIREKLADVKDWKGARDFKEWLHNFEPEAQKVGGTVARSGAELSEYARAHPEEWVKAIKDPQKFPDVFQKPLAPATEAAPGLEGLDKRRAVEDAKDTVHLAMMKAQQELVERMGPDLSAQIADGLQKENAVTALRNVFGKLENVPVPERKSVLASGAGALRGRRSGAALAVSFLAHAAGFHAAIPATIAWNVGKQALEAGAKKQVFAKAMRTMLGTSRPNTGMTLDAVKRLDERITGGVEALMGDLASGKSAQHEIPSTLSAFLPNAGAGLSRAAQLSVLRRAVTREPEVIADHFAALTAPLHDEGLAPVATAFATHQTNVMKVLAAALGQDPKSVADPFEAPKDGKESPADAARMDRTLAIVGDPMVLLKLVSANTITETDVAIAQYTNPATLQKIRHKAVEKVLEDPQQFSYQQEISMNLLMGRPRDGASKATVPTLQSVYGAPANAPIGPRQGVENKGMNAKGQDHFLESSLTTSQRSIVGPR